MTPPPGQKIPPRRIFRYLWALSVSAAVFLPVAFETSRPWWPQMAGTLESVCHAWEAIRHPGGRN